MSSSPPPSTPEVRGRAIGIAAMVLAIATPVAAGIGVVLTAMTEGPAALAVGVLSLTAVGCIALIATVVAVVSLFVSRPNIVAKLALVLVGATAIVIFLLIFPPNLWFA